MENVTKLNFVRSILENKNFQDRYNKTNSTNNYQKNNSSNRVLVKN